MRYLVALCAMLALPVTAQSPVLLYRFACVNDQIIVQIKANEPGIFQLAIPHNTCGRQI
jgi:hypothetical protein